MAVYVIDSIILAEGVCKIGITTNDLIGLEREYTRAYGHPRIHFFGHCLNPELAEHLIHNELAALKIFPNHELFRVVPGICNSEQLISICAQIVSKVNNQHTGMVIDLENNIGKINNKYICNLCGNAYRYKTRLDSHRLNFHS